jgi:hypothetical protein
MRALVDWYNTDRETHPIIRAALFVYDFLSIHPFQDGNGRLSRLLATLLLLRQGYSWIQYVSFEHEIENRKKEYYQVLMECQRQRPGEDVYSWVVYFLECLNNIQGHLLNKLEVKGSAASLSAREKKIYTFIESYPGSQSGGIAERLDIPLPTVKRVLSDMLSRKILTKNGIGKGTNYTVGNVVSVKTDLFFKLSNQEGKVEFLLMSPSSFIEIKRIVLTPLFDWTQPDDWSIKLAMEGLSLVVTLNRSNGSTSRRSYLIYAYDTPYHYRPVFILNNPIHIPTDLSDNPSNANEYPVNVTIELKGESKEFAFDVTVIYDAVIE